MNKMRGFTDPILDKVSIDNVNSTARIGQGLPPETIFNGLTY